VGALPSIQKLWEKHGGKGLHIFLAECQGGTMEDLSKYAKDRGLTFPITIGNGAFGGYEGGRGLPYAFVIGPDGKVVQQGHSGYESVIEKELKRIKYFGLGKLEVARGLEKAATLFSAGDYAKAAADAAKVKEKNSDDAAVVADADWIIARVDLKASMLRAKVEKGKESRRYHEAQAALEKLAGRGFKGMEVAEKAAAELKEMKSDKAVQKEIRAWNMLAQLQDADKRIKDGATRKRNLEGFAKRYEGTAAAEEALKLAGEISTD